MSKNNEKKKARRKARKARETRRATPKTDASRAQRTSCTDACVDTCQSEYEAMLRVAGEIEAMGGNVSFGNSNTGNVSDNDDKAVTAMTNLNVLVTAKDIPVVWVRQTDDGPTIDFDGNTILELVKDGQQGASRIRLQIASAMGNIPIHISLKSTHPESAGETVLEVVRTARASWFDWSPERLEAIRRRFLGGDYSDGHGQLVLTFGDIADAIMASDIPCIDEAWAC